MIEHQRCEVERWIDFLGPYLDQRTSHYDYSIVDFTPDDGFLFPDASKHQREATALRTCLHSDWEVMIDFGCGPGAHFDLANPSAWREALFLGIEPDPRRADWARENARKTLANVSHNEVVNADVGLLEKAPDGLVADNILCCQVLGHTSARQTARILEAFGKVLRQSGCLALALPVVGPQFRGDLTADDWGGERDYPHLVDVRHSSREPGFRQTITLDKFDMHAEKPAPQVLPVRCFFVPDFPDPSEVDYPVAIDAPPTVARLIRDEFEISSTQLYHLHARSDGDVPAIGDAVLCLHKT